MSTGNTKHIGDTFYAEIDQLYPSQLRFTRHIINRKIDKAATKGYLSLGGDGYSLSDTQNQSVYPLSDPTPVVKTCFGYALVDNHHRVAAAKIVGAKAHPVKLVADYSHLRDDELWKELGKQCLAYPFDTQGNFQTPPKSFADLQDDPLRYFAAISARKFEGQPATLKSSGTTYPLWIKINKEPFTEFKIANQLYKHNFKYHYDIKEDELDSLIEQAREILTKDPIPGLRLVTTRMRFDHSPQIKAWLEEYEKTATRAA